MRYIIYIVVCICCAGKVVAQQSITIQHCYTKARQNYPLLKQLDLINKTATYNIENAAKGFLPQVSINGQASYQSAVTEIPLKVPGMESPKISKDQYKLYAEVNQVLYDGGMIKLQQQSQKANADIDKQKVEVELYRLKERINQLFFSVLIIDEQLKQTTLLKKDIQLGLNKTEAFTANGTALKSAANVLKAELLKADQRNIELQSARKGYLDMLGLFINLPLQQNAVLEKPLYQPASREINRPELKLYDYQYKGLDVQTKMIKAKNQPKFSMFLQAGAGRPALNFLDNDIKPYYMGGLRMSWPITGAYTSKNERAAISISRKSIDLQKETFLLNTNIQLKQQDAEVAKYEQLLSTDDELIDLRAGVKSSAFAQLENGVINSSDYLREVNAEDQARQNKILHGIQLLMSQYNNQTTTGN